MQGNFILTLPSGVNAAILRYDGANNVDPTSSPTQNPIPLNEASLHVRHFSLQWHSKTTNSNLTKQFLATHQPRSRMSTYYMTFVQTKVFETAWRAFCRRRGLRHTNDRWRGKWLCLIFLLEQALTTLRRTAICSRSTIIRLSPHLSRCCYKFLAVHNLRAALCQADPSSRS